MLEILPNQHWNDLFSNSTQEQTLKSLESGKIIYLPHLNFCLLAEEKQFLSPAFIRPHVKNISFNLTLNKLWGVSQIAATEYNQLKEMLSRFANCARLFIQQLLPRYHHALLIGRTSFRPIQIANRKTSIHKDDKRLHVDAFPSSPNQGKRILRVFCNINPYGEERVWRIGEPFEKVAEQFIPKIKKPLPGSAFLLYMLHITKSKRTLYDHYMLRMHNEMKADNEYQKNCAQQQIGFPAGSAWVVQTDHVSHAALQGQYLLEQTFYLPPTAMQNEAHAPLRILEKLLKTTLT